VPPVVAYLAMRPATFAQTVPYQLSTSQLIGLLSALVVSFFYARFWEQARKNPSLSMSLGDAAAIRELKGETAEAEEQADEEEQAEEGEEAADDETAEAPRPAARTGQGKKKGLAAKAKGKDKPAPAGEKAEPSEGKGDPEPEGT
jgi:phosphatidylglycerol:prolipoprotein diacylglycerol transferase